MAYRADDGILLHLRRTMAQAAAVSGAQGSNLIFRQLFEHKSFTYSYLLADATTREAVLIDPVIETVDRDLRLVYDLDLTLKYAMNTHVHADHVTGSGRLKTMIKSCQSVISADSGAVADVHIKNGEEVVFGSHRLEARSTPGHTNGCMSYVLHGAGMVFSGDALLIRGCGRTDFQQGSSETLYKSVHDQIFTLPDNFTVYPAHDYTGQTSSTVGEEKRLNPRLTKPVNEFVRIMKQLNLPYPAQIDKSLPANLVCGLQDLPEARS